MEPQFFSGGFGHRHSQRIAVAYNRDPTQLTALLLQILQKAIDRADVLRHDLPQVCVWFEMLCNLVAVH